MKSLVGGHVFLSASFPSGERGEKFQPFDAAAVADAVSAIVRAVLVSEGKLLFGGHPTITPLVLMIGAELRVRRAVDVFQSEWFRDEVTPETWSIQGSDVGSIHWTPRLSSRDDRISGGVWASQWLRRPACNRWASADTSLAAQIETGEVQVRHVYAIVRTSPENAELDQVVEQIGRSVGGRT